MKLIVIEDEIKTLNGVVALIRELDAKYEIAGTAQSGEEGIELILKERPDIVITDIQMSGMSGLEMIRQINETELSCKFIILSGYADFQYAREALKLGSVDYLLKPITKETLCKTLEQVAEVIQNANAEISLQSYTEEELFAKVISIQEEKDNIFVTEFLKRFSDDKKQCIVFIKSETRVVPTQIELFKQSIKHHMTGIPCIFSISENKKEIWLLLQDVAYSDVENRIDRILGKEKNNPKNVLFCAVIDFEKIEELQNNMQKLQDNVQWNLSLKHPAVITEQLIQNMECSSFTYPAQIEREIIKRINSKKTEEIENLLQQFAEYITMQTYRYKDIKEAMICLTVAILYSIRKANYGIYQEISHLNILDWVKNRLSVSSYITLIMNMILQYEQYHKNISNSTNPIISKVLQMIEEEYKEDINLEDFAMRLNITPEYLSSLFIKEIGIKFTAYCTQKKIESAKTMLQNKNIKIYEVAEKNGYMDVRYFCKVFKKYTGISPSEYMHLE